MTVHSPPPPSDRLLRRVLTIAGGVAALWALVVWTTGGTSLVIVGLRVSSRSAIRPALVAAVCWLVVLARLSAAERRTYLGGAAAGADRWAPWAAVALALALGAVAAVFGAHVAGASDSSGYLSQSRLWAQGRIQVPAAAIAPADWPLRGHMVSPLGYAPAVIVDVVGPTYAPGLPWLMALGAAIAGEPGRFLWTPMLASVLVWGTFVLARRRAPPGVALAAALLVATSWPVLHEAMQTMSDLPAAALWLVALLWLSSTGPWSAAGSGLLAGLALAMRPNLVLVAGAVWLSWLLTDARPLAARLRRAAVFAAPMAAAALVVALINTQLWGSPLRSGYGPNADLFSPERIAPNLANLWRWTQESRSYWCAIGVVALPWLAVTSPRPAWTPWLAMSGAVVASYLPYAIFDEWWYLRFYLPAWPALAAAAVVAAWQLAARRAPLGAGLLVLGAAGVTGVLALNGAVAHGLFDLWRGEQRYAAVATWVRDHSSPDAVVLSVQHSGAINYYARRTVGRYDWIAPSGLDQLCLRLAADGRDVLLVTDDWEEPEFRRRFDGQTRGRLDWAPVAEARVGAARVRVYDLVTPTRAVGPGAIPVARRAPWPWARPARLAAPK